MPSGQTPLTVPLATSLGHRLADKLNVRFILEAANTEPLLQELAGRDPLGMLDTARRLHLVELERSAFAAMLHTLSYEHLDTLIPGIIKVCLFLSGGGVLSALCSVCTVPASR